MIIIAENPLDKNKCSDKCQLILASMAGAEEWLTWATENPNFFLSVKTEDELLTRIQEGLHGPGLICLPDIGLLVHPCRLAQLSEDDLSLLLSGPKTSSMQKIQKTLQENHLFSITDFEEGQAFLSDLNVESALIFKTISLPEQILLSELSRKQVRIPESSKSESPTSESPTSGTTDPKKTETTKQQKKTKRSEQADITKEGAAFAIATAQSTTDFVNRYLFYLSSIEKYPESAQKPDTRKKQVQVTWENLTNHCNNLLETFSIGKNFYETDLSLDIRTSVNNGFDIGFQSKASAMVNVLKYTEYGTKADQDIKSIIDAYQDSIKNVIRLGKIDTIRLSQNGLSQSYTYTHSNNKVILNVDTLGVVTATYGNVGQA